VLRELSKMEQRYEAVLGIRDGLDVTEVAQAYGVSRQGLHSWLARYEHDGLEGLKDRSHQPRTSPLQMPAATEARVLELRRRRPWGQVNIAHQLGREAVDPVPSLSATHRALVRHGLIEPKQRRKRLPTYKRWERGRPMELWQRTYVSASMCSHEDPLRLTSWHLGRLGPGACMADAGTVGYDEFEAVFSRDTPWCGSCIVSLGRDP